MNRRSFQNALREGPQLGFCSMYPAPGIIERIGQDWDWCWIDCQHGEWGLDDAIDAARACNLVGIFSLVRVPGPEAGIIGKILDTACDAVMVPMIDSAEQAEQVVQAARFAPRGKRSYGGRRPIDLYGRAYSQAESPQPLVVCQIESPVAVERVDEIAAVNGVDALFFGPDDMALARGMPMDQPRPEGCFDTEMRAVAEAARRHGKIAAGVFMAPDDAKQAVEWGYRLIVCVVDVPLLANNSMNAAKTFRAETGKGNGVKDAGTSMY